MNLTDTLALFDRYQRRDIVYPGIERVATATLVRHIDRAAHCRTIVYTTLVGAPLDTIITQELADAAAHNHALEWKLYAHDDPSVLGEHLARHGLVIGDPETVMILDLTEMPEQLTLPVRHTVRKATIAADQHTIIAIVQASGTSTATEIVSSIAYEQTIAPSSISIYIADIDDVPASTGWIRFDTATMFASLWGGSTIPAARQRGLYTALLATRAQEARRRGYRFLTIDAGPMSQPILARYGFTVLTTTWPCIAEAGG